MSGRATTRHAWVAGDGSALPAASTARTRNVWSPSASAGYWTAESHGSNAPPSSAHSNVVPVSEAVNVRFASGLPVTAGGPNVTVVSGAVSSTTVHVSSVGTCSTIGFGLCVCTRKLCAPTGSPLYVFGELQIANGAPSSEHSNVSPATGAENTNVALRVLGRGRRARLDRDRLRDLADLPAPLRRGLVDVAARRAGAHQQLVLAERQARVHAVTHGS